MQLTPNPLPGAPPFRLQTRPEEAFAHPSWQAARDGALAALARGEAVAVLGAPGTGKTLLLQALTEALRADGKRCRLLGPAETVPERADCDVLLVDEGGTLLPETLAALCRFDAPFILAGLPEFAPRLQGCKRHIEVLSLAPLSPEDVARFVASRLSATGRMRDTFEAGAVLALARQSGGSMRLVTVLASAALFFAEQEGAAQVSRRHVDEAAAMREVMQEAPEPEPAPAPAVAVILPAQEEPTPVAEPAMGDEPIVSSRPRRGWAYGGALAALIGLVSAVAIGWSLAGRPGKPSPGPRSPAVAERAPAPPVVAQAAPVAPPPAPPQVAQPAPVAARSAPPQVAQVQPPTPDRPAAIATAEPAPRPSRPPPPRPAPAPAPAPEPAEIGTAAASLAFRGSILNETMGQGGQLALALRTQGGSGPITAHFHAYAGLIGTGELTGTLSPDGRITLSGRLMMGRNPFDCTLTGILAGDRLTGAALFIRAGGGTTARSTFSLSRS